MWSRASVHRLCNRTLRSWATKTSVRSTSRAAAERWRKQLFSSSSSSSSSITFGSNQTATAAGEKMDSSRIYRYFNLHSFSDEEFHGVFHQIASRDGGSKTDTNTISNEADAVSIDDTQDAVGGDSKVESSGVTSDEIQFDQLHEFLRQRILAEDGLATKGATLGKDFSMELHQERIRDYSRQEAERLWRHFVSTSDASEDATLTRQDFVDRLHTIASAVDYQRTLPVTASMLLVGSSVGVMTPAMPFVVEALSLSATQYGWVVSAFALSKMLGNIPFAVMVERHGRKPYMTYSLLGVALGVTGIGFATGFEQLYLCRLTTGLGVAALSTAATLMVTDMSTPLNRASTMAPIMSAFSTGTALGPALGGYMVDSFGIQPTFVTVGCGFLSVAALNRVLLAETKVSDHMTFPWSASLRKGKGETKSISDEVQNSLGQWAPLFRQPKIRSALFLNMAYWVSLAGGQMTLLPLVLTDSAGLNFTATQVGQVYMTMSMIQIVGNPVFARGADTFGKVPSMIAGCTFIASGMYGLTQCTEPSLQFGAALAIWGAGSSMLSTSPLAYISDQAPEQRAQAIAMLRTCGDVGFLLGASATGAWATYVQSLELAMQSSAGLLLTATGWFAARQYLLMQQDKVQDDKLR